MPGMVSKVQDPILQKQIKDVEAKLTDPEMRKSYDQIMVAGMRLLFDDKTHPMVDEYLEQIQRPEDVPKIMAHGIVKLLSVIQNESKQQEPLRAVGPAGTSLMAMALELMEKRNGIDVTREMLAQSVLLLKEGIFDLYKITPQVLEQLQKRGQAGAAPQGPPQSPPTPQPAGA